MRTYWSASREVRGCILIGNKDGGGGGGGGGPCRIYVMCMLAIGMGDLNAVDVAQEVHLEVL